MNYQLLLEEVRQYVESYFKTHTNPALFYHNLLHTKEVANAAAQIANHYQLSDEDFLITGAAAWFHDTGYFDEPENHEAKSAELALAFLQNKQLDAAAIQAVKDCILATRVPQQPVGLLQQIVCDADLFHLGTDNFTERTKLMRKEYEAVKHATLSKQEWWQRNIKFLAAHHYYTDYSKLLLDAGKEKNLNDLRKKEKEWQKENELQQAKTETVNEVTPKDNTQAAKPKKGDSPDKGVETMFRVTSSNHQRLSDMADNKAHIMITVNSIILSAIISLLLRRLEDHPYLTIPTFIILAVSLAAMIFAILSTRPHIPRGIFTPKEVEDKTVNLLFFGNFYRMNLSDYKAGMEQMMKDRSFLYGSLIKDVYSQGVVLGRKYRLLRLSYNIFMYGLIVSVLAFMTVYAFDTKY